MKMLIGLILAGIATILAVGAAAYYADKEGYKRGMHDYHGLCQAIPGVRIDNQDGSVVYCYGMGTIPQEELKQL